MTTTTKRERHVYPSYEIPHLWANRTQHSAHNSGRNVSLLGDDLYSYGTLIGRHVTSARGERAVLLTTRGYSKTTAKLQKWARSATSHLNVFHVDNVRMNRSEAPAQFKIYAERLADLCLRFDRARINKPFIMHQIQSLVTEANKFAQFYGLRSRLSDGDTTARIAKLLEIL